MAKDQKNESVAAAAAAAAAPAASSFTPSPSIAPPPPGEALIARAPERPRAVVVGNDERVICRPPPGVHSSQLGDVVIGNWVGRHDGKQVRVTHCTPVHGLPSELIAKIAATEGQRIGPFPPPPSAGG